MGSPAPSRPWTGRASTAGLRALVHLRVAFAFLTVLPVGPRSFPDALAPARAYFPLVGLALGGALAGVDAGLRQVFPVGVAAAGDLALLLALTRALHVEGFVDCCDALGGGYSRERRLEILRDPHVGAFGVIGAIALLLVQWSAIAALPGSVRLETLVLLPALSRWGVVLAMASFPYARREGMGRAFQRGRQPEQVAVALAVALAAGLGLGGGAGLALLALATAAAWGVGRWAAGLLGGLTGDTYGMVNEVAATAVLLLALALGAEAGATFGWPLFTGA